MPTALMQEEYFLFDILSSALGEEKTNYYTEKSHLKLLI